MSIKDKFIFITGGAGFIANQIISRVVNDNKIIIPVYNSSKEHNRISFSIELLKSAKNRIFGVLGEKKKKIYNDLKLGKENNYPLKYLINNNSLDYWIIKH